MNNELRTEINQIILGLPENKLQPVLDYLKGLEKYDDDKINTAEALKKIFDEDANLLKRLAQ